MRKGDKVRFVYTGNDYDANELGILQMTLMPKQELKAGDVGYIITGVKSVKEIKVGDTITHAARPAEGVVGFEEVKPMEIGRASCRERVSYSV